MKIKILFFLLVFGIGFLFYYFNEYKIENDKEAIQSSLKVWLNRGYSMEVDEPNILKVVQLDDSKSYVSLFQFHEGYGYAHLVEGINGKLKIVTSSHGGSLINNRLIETSEGMYIVLYGKNPDLKINTILINSRNKIHDLKLNMPDDESLLIYEKVPDHFENPLPDEFILLDGNDNEIELVHYFN